jgi:hypothetical protein
MRTEEELLKAMGDMAKDAGEVFAHLRAAEEGLKRALARIPDSEVMEIDPETELGMKVDGIRLVLRRAVLPVAAACGALAGGVAPAQGGQEDGPTVRLGRSPKRRLEFAMTHTPAAICMTCGAPILRMEGGLS